MLKVTAAEICTAVNGELYGSAKTLISEVCIDSRKITENCLFIAIKGENFDGNDYVLSAFEQGADIAIASRKINIPDDKSLVVVDDTRKAMLALAGYIRNKLKLRLIGVTGSVGKTTTKEMIFGVLSSSFNTHKTEGNFNNEVGLPLTLFKLREDHEAAVIEMGMSAAGEISVLTRAAEPTVAVITNIGMSHIEHLKSRENILKAKMEITEGLKDGGVLIINGDDEYLSKIGDTGFKTVKYGMGESCQVKGEMIAPDRLLVNGRVISMPIEGEHNMYNALAAIAVGLECGISLEKAAYSIENYKTDKIRQNIVKIGDITVICDYYNANPQSVEAALELLKSGGAGRRIAVLGDMLELGDYKKECHEKVGVRTAEAGADAVFAFGEMAETLAGAAKNAGVKNAFAFSDKKELSEKLVRYLEKGDRVLIKGSRGMKMEEVYEVISNAMGN